MAVYEIKPLLSNGSSSGGDVTPIPSKVEGKIYFVSELPEKGQIANLYKLPDDTIWSWYHNETKIMDPVNLQDSFDLIFRNISKDRLKSFLEGVRQEILNLNSQGIEISEEDFGNYQLFTNNTTGMYNFPIPVSVYIENELFTLKSKFYLKWFVIDGQLAESVDENELYLGGINIKINNSNDSDVLFDFYYNFMNPLSPSYVDLKDQKWLLYYGDIVIVQKEQLDILEFSLYSEWYNHLVETYDYNINYGDLNFLFDAGYHIDIDEGWTQVNYEGLVFDLTTGTLSIVDDKNRVISSVIIPITEVIVSVTYDTQNNLLIIKDIQGNETSIPIVDKYTQGTGIIIENNTISIDDSKVVTTDTDQTIAGDKTFNRIITPIIKNGNGSLGIDTNAGTYQFKQDTLYHNGQTLTQGVENIVGGGITSNVNVTFGSTGNYKSILDLSNLVYGSDYADNGETNTQFKYGSILRINLKAGGHFTLEGYPNYSNYKVTINGTTTESTGIYQSPNCLYDQTVTIEGNDSLNNNYYISMTINDYVNKSLTEAVQDIPEVVANPEGTATDDLETVLIGNKIYNVGGGSSIELYEHNITLYANSTNDHKRLSFTILTNNNTPLTKSTAATLLYSRGFTDSNLNYIPVTGYTYGNNADVKSLVCAIFSDGSSIKIATTSMTSSASGTGSVASETLTDTITKLI